MELKKKTKLAVVAVTLTLTSCLDQYPQDFTAPSTWYKTEEQLTSALAAVYDPLTNIYSTYISVQFAQSTDEAFSKESSPALQPYYYNFDASDNSVLQAWRQLYKGIDNANALLENLGNSECPEEFNNQLKGEALFLRGYYHFLLTAYWGDVPLKLHSTTNAEEAHSSRTASADIYKAVFKDMQDALDLVPDISEIGFAGKVSKQAVKGILARVYLNAAGRLGKPEYYKDARDWAKSLIDEGSCSLLPSYSQIFIDMMQDKYNIKESIFEVECFGNTDSQEMKECGLFVSYFTPYYTFADYVSYTDNSGNKASLARGRGVFYTTPRFFDSFEEGDLRRDWAIMPYFYSNEAKPVKTYYNAEFRFRYIGKFRREYEINLPVYSWGNSTNFPLLRYSDVLLMFAEADYEVNGENTPAAIEALNQVRRRAFGKNPVETDAGIDLVQMSREEFTSYIRAERARELAFESHRKLDLLRWGIFVDYMHEIGEEIAAIPLMDNKNPIFFQNGSGFPSTAVNPTGVEMMARPFRNVASKHILMPIPSSEIMANRLLKENNTGW